MKNSKKSESTEVKANPKGCKEIVNPWVEALKETLLYFHVV